MQILIRQSIDFYLFDINSAFYNYGGTYKKTISKRKRHEEFVKDGLCWAATLWSYCDLSDGG